jgi:ribosomal protein S18 acetylase RimI-like enzyme
MIHIKQATDAAELQGIRSLQLQNLKKNLEHDEAEKEGFVTAEYSIEFLQAMNRVSPAIIAKDGNTVVGYVLATVKSLGLQHDLLRDLFNVIDTLNYDQQPLKDGRYLVIGQLCVAKGYRGRGIVQKMYNAFREVYSKEFDYGITDVAYENPRSLKAHLKSGFKLLDTLE